MLSFYLRNKHIHLGNTVVCEGQGVSSLLGSQGGLETMDEVKGLLQFEFPVVCWPRDLFGRVIHLPTKKQFKGSCASGISEIHEPCWEVLPLKQPSDCCQDARHWRHTLVPAELHRQQTGAV